MGKAFRKGLRSPHAKLHLAEYQTAMETEIIGTIIARLNVHEEDLLGLMAGTHRIVRRDSAGQAAVEGRA